MAVRTKKTQKVGKPRRGPKLEDVDEVIKTAETPEKPKRKTFRYLVIAIILIGLLYVSRSVFIAATVNGRPISRLSVVKLLEKQSGKEVLETLISEEIVSQEARKKGIEVTQTEIDEFTTRITGSLTEQGQNLDDLLKLQGMTRAEFERQVRFQLLAQKIVGEQSSLVTEEEIKEFVETNKAYFPNMTDEQVKEEAKKQLTNQKTNTKIQEWIAGARESANINYLVDY